LFARREGLASVRGDDHPLTRNRDGASHHDLFIIDNGTGLVARHE
jgi:hypothetical protein